MIHHVYANTSNAGDWLSALGIQRLLGEPVAEHLCDEPFVPETLAALGRLGERDLIVIGGGGLFHAYFTPFWRGLAELGARAPIVVWGVGDCDLKAEQSSVKTSLLEPILRRAALVVVRDERTRRRLGGLAPEPPLACPSLALLEAAPEPGSGILHAVNLTTVGRKSYRAMRRAGRAWARSVGRPYRETSNRFETGARHELERCLGLYRSSELVLSSRLHGCIFAAGLGRRVIAVSGDWKIEEFMALAGLEEWVLDAARVEALPELLGRVSEQSPPGAFCAELRGRLAGLAARVRALHAG